MSENLETRLNRINQNSNSQLQDIANVYREILYEMNETIIKARKVSELDMSIKGIVELKQLLKIMDGTFLKVAQEVIVQATVAEQQAQAEAETEESSETE